MREIRQRSPDAVVVDISLGGSFGIELILEIKLAFPKVAVLVLSMHEESAYVERALRAGALGYAARIKEKLHLNSATELLRQAILWDQRDKATG